MKKSTGRCFSVVLPVSTYITKTSFTLAGFVVLPDLLLYIIPAKINRAARACNTRNAGVSTTGFPGF